MDMTEHRGLESQSKCTFVAEQVPLKGFAQILEEMF